MSDRTTDQRLDAIEANLGILARTVRDIALALGVRDRIRDSLDDLRGINGNGTHDTEPAPPCGEEGDAA